MKLFENKLFFRYLFVGIAVCIVVGSLIVSHSLIRDLSKEERSKINIWAEAVKEAAVAEDNANMHLIVHILESNTTIPVILYDEKDNYYTSTNLELPETGEQDFLRKQADSFKKKNGQIVIEMDDMKQYIYYDDSYTLKRLQIYPYIQLGVLAIFILAIFFALLSTTKMEQDRLWVGLSKETAHQLGTPISSLLAWLEYLRLKNADTSIVDDMEKDVGRLQMITDRFSKIGSAPSLEKANMADVAQQTITYLEKRISKKVIFNVDFPSQSVYAYVSESLFSWVIENLTKNAVDAMGGQGRINFKLYEKGSMVCIDIQDTGKGIPKSKFKTIFSPGYTTKSRGWGLGLSLTKRIIESYHKGRIYVSASEINVGTTFHIELQKS